MSATHHKLRALAAAIAAAGTIAAAAPAAANAQYDTKPTGVMCTTYNAKLGTGIARMGYDNTGIGIETIPAGDLNYIDPDPINRGQPEQFIPGNGSWDMKFSAGDTVGWAINGKVSTSSFTAADLPFSVPCPEAGPSITAVAPVAVAPGSGPQRLTVFGQNLGDVSVSVSGDGVSIDPSMTTTEQRLDATMTVASDAATGARDVLVTTSDGRQAGCRGCLVIDPGAQGTAGPKGDTGPQGPKGDTGPQGPAGKDAVSAVTRVTGTPAAFDSSTITAVADCPAGTKVISGGYEITGGTLPALTEVLANHPATDRQWAVTVHVTGPRAGRRLAASATCLG